MGVILQVFVIFVGATIAVELLRPLRQPPIVAELAVGVVLGPHVLGLIHLNQATSTLASLGVIVLMFTAGLELRVTDLTSVGTSALSVSVTGVVLTTAGILGVASAFGLPADIGIRAGVMLAATSVGVTARVLTDLGVLRGKAARIVVGAAVIDDIVVLVAFSILLALGSSRSTGSIVATAIGAVGFVVLVAVVGPGLARRHGRLLDHPRTARSPLVFALVICLGLAVLAERVGLAALIGAFLAGMTLAETRDQIPLEGSMTPLYEFLVPFFFVLSGARVDIRALTRSGLGLTLAIVGVAIAAKLVAGLASRGIALRERFFVGSGMIPRGEVTIAAAAAALAARSIPHDVYAAILAAVFVSAVVAPPALRALEAPRKS